MYKEDYDLESKLRRLVTTDVNVSKAIDEELSDKNKNLSHVTLDQLEASWRVHSMMIDYLGDRGSLFELASQRLHLERSRIEYEMMSRGFEFRSDEQGRLTLPIRVK